MQPLAIVYYERLMPGGQLANRLRDAGYRIFVFNKPELLLKTVQKEMPMILFTELTAGEGVFAAIQDIKADPTTCHIPIVAYAPDNAPAPLAEAQKAGANLAVSDSALLNHLPQWIDQALHID